MSQLAQTISAGWACLFVAGLWSLGCGWQLRRAWADGAEQAQARRLGAETVRMQADLASRDHQIQALEADLVQHRNRMAQVEATGTAEMQMLSMNLASSTAKAAGLSERLQAAQRTLADWSAKADAERAAARSAWDRERAALEDEHGARLAALERAHGQALQSVENEVATLAAEVTRLTHIEAHADNLRSRLESSQAMLRDKCDALDAVERRMLLLAPLPARVAQAENDLATLRRKWADRNAALARLWTEEALPGPPGRRPDNRS